METREHQELLNELPIDFTHSALEPLPEDLFIELTQEIMRRAPAKMTLFAQASSYWRSYHYLRQLQDAVLMQFDEEQERILTNLLINSTLLLKEEAKENLQYWIFYLKKYYANPGIDIKNRVLAQALLLIVDKSCQQRDWVEFEFVLRAYCFSMRWVPRHQLFHSLKAIVMMGKGEVVSTQGLDIKALLNLDYNCICSVYEAQLILAPFVSVGLLAGNFLSFTAESFDDMGYARVSNLNCVLLLHAALRLMPSKSDFWRQVQKTLPQIISQLPRLLPYSDNTKLRAARIDFVATLFRFTAANVNFWNNEQRDSLDDMTEQVLDLVQDRVKAKKLCSLTNDDERISWLTESFNKQNLDWSLFSFVPRVCAQLRSDGARAKAIDILLPLIKVEEVVGARGSPLIEANNKIVVVIRALVARCQSAQIKMATARQLCEMIFKNPECFHSGHAPFLFSFPLEEKHLSRLEAEYLHLKQWSQHGDTRYLQTFFFSHLTEQQIDYWLKKFQHIRDSFSDKDYASSSNYCYYWFSSIYTRLLAKSRHPALLQKWQEALYQLHLDDKFLIGSNAREFAMKILPYLTDERAIKQWMVVLMKELKERHGDLINGVFLSDFSHCMNGLLPRLSPELRADYCQQIKDIVFPVIIDKSHTYYQAQNLNNLLSLLQHLSDEMIVELANSPPTHESPVSPSTTLTR